MRRATRVSRHLAAASATLLLAALVGVLGQGCGGDDHHGGSAEFTGNVSAVAPAQASVPLRHRPLLAALGWWLPSAAIAQSSCPALHVLACASNGNDTQCHRVDSDSCAFDVSIDTLDSSFASGMVFFVDDANGNGSQDDGEATATLTNELGSVCNGSVVTLSGVVIDFLGSTATAVSVVKNPDTCPATTPTPVTTVTPTKTATPYSAAASLNQPPSTLLAFLFGSGAVGLVLPRRRSQR